MNKTGSVVLNHRQANSTEAEIEEYVREFIVGQDRAVRHLARTINRANVMGGRLRDLTKPAGSFFYLGPTGVGKTRMVEVCAQFLFGSPIAMTKINCSELQHSHEMARLLGAPPGYIKSDEEPWLVQSRLDTWGFFAHIGGVDEHKKVRHELEDVHRKLQELEKERARGKKSKDDTTNEDNRRIIEETNKLNARYHHLAEMLNYEPGSYPIVLLFDEIEKAHPDLFNILLQIHDKARLTVHGTPRDGNHDVLFHNALVFYTSNVAQSLISRIVKGQGTIGLKPPTTNASKTDDDVYKTAVRELGKVFPREFLGRIRKENVIVFSPFTQDDIREGLDRIILKDFNFKLLSVFPIKVELTERAKCFIVGQSFDSDNRTFGMRAVESVFEKSVADAIMRFIANGPKNENGLIPGDIVVVDEEDGRLMFSRMEREQQQLDNKLIFVDESPMQGRPIAVFKPAKR